jgi:hypothetical protein
MQFLTFDQAQREPYTGQYRHSPAASLAEFKLRDDGDLDKLDEQLAAEQARQAPMHGKWVRHRSKDGDYPVRVADGFLRIQWSVFPRLPQVIKDLSGRVDVRDTIKPREDFTNPAMKTV